MDKSSSDEKRTPEEVRNTPRRSIPSLWVVLAVMAMLALFIYLNRGPQRSDIHYSFFLEQIRSGNVVAVTLSPNMATGRFKTPPQRPAALNTSGETTTPSLVKKPDREKLAQYFKVVLPYDNERARGELTALLDEHKVPYENAAPDNSIL